MLGQQRVRAARDRGLPQEQFVPAQVDGLTTAVAIATGEAHTCALMSGGSVSCWGANSYGQLGTGSTLMATVPVATIGVTAATAITAGVDHTCAVLGNGTVSCWGRNTFGQLGDGTTADAWTAVTVSDLVTATNVTAGQYHTCARLAGGSVECSGRQLDRADRQWRGTNAHSRSCCGHRRRRDC